MVVVSACSSRKDVSLDLELGRAGIRCVTEKRGTEKDMQFRDAQCGILGAGDLPKVATEPGKGAPSKGAALHAPYRLACISAVLHASLQTCMHI